MSNARSPREVCSTTIGISGLMVLALFRLPGSIPPGKCKAAPPPRRVYQPGYAALVVRAAGREAGDGERTAACLRRIAGPRRGGAAGGGERPSPAGRPELLAGRGTLRRDGDRRVDEAIERLP